MGFAMSGGNTVAASDATALAVGNTLTFRMSATYVLTGLNNVATTFTSQYKVAGGGNCTFGNRNITVIPF